MGKLAPDEEVRKSPFWTKKTGEKPDGVTRRGRLQFAAHRCITNDSGRTALLVSVDETLRSYDRLPEAHKRGALSIDKANEAFKANDSILRRWIDPRILGLRKIRALTSNHYLLSPTSNVR